MIKGKQNRRAQGQRQHQQHRGKVMARRASRVRVGPGERNQGKLHTTQQTTTNGRRVDEIPISRIIQHLTQTQALVTVVLNVMEIQ